MSHACKILWALSLEDVSCSSMKSNARNHSNDCQPRDTYSVYGANCLGVVGQTPIIAPTIPPSPDYTPASPDYSPASDSESDPYKDLSSDHIPLLPATSPFLSSDDDTTDSDTPDTPPSPTYGTPFTEITFSTQRSPVIPRCRVMILAPG
ncbi:hypothetical protein Tco_1363422 [Tanacetum coccineum]